MVVVMLDLSRIGVMRLSGVRSEVAVRYDVFVVVPDSSLVDVLRRERRGEQEVGAGQKDCRGARQGPNHDCIIRGCGVSVNEVVVTGRSETGQ